MTSKSIAPLYKRTVTTALTPPSICCFEKPVVWLMRSIRFLRVLVMFDLDGRSDRQLRSTASVVAPISATSSMDLLSRGHFTRYGGRLGADGTSACFHRCWSSWASASMILGVTVIQPRSTGQSTVRCVPVSLAKLRSESIISQHAVMSVPHILYS